MKITIQDPPAIFLENEIHQAICRYNLELLHKCGRNEISGEEYLRLKFPEQSIEIIEREFRNAVQKWEGLAT